MTVPQLAVLQHQEAEESEGKVRLVPSEARWMDVLETRDWTKWNEEHRPFGKGHYQKIGDKEAEAAWARGHHEVHAEHDLDKAQGKLTTDTDHAKEARKEVARSFGKPLKKLNRRDRQLTQAYHEGRAHAHHDLAKTARVNKEGILALAGAFRIEPGIFDTRNWKEWDEEHPYIKHGHHGYKGEGGHHKPFASLKDVFFGSGHKHVYAPPPPKTPEQLAAEKAAREAAAALAAAEHARRAVLAGKYADRDLHAEGDWAPRDWASRYGGVMFDPQGRLLMREPLNHFDGYHWTFSKGHPDAKDEHPSQVAIRETEEETGLHPRIIGHVPGGYGGTSSRNHFYLMEDSGQGFDPTIMNGETQSLAWATPAQADIMIQKGTNAQGVYRDRQILRAAVAAHEKATGIHNIQLAPLGPPPEIPKPKFVTSFSAKPVKASKAPKLDPNSPVAKAKKAKGPKQEAQDAGYEDASTTAAKAGLSAAEARQLADQAKAEMQASKPNSIGASYAAGKAMALMDHADALDQAEGKRADPDHDPASTMVSLDIPPGTIEPVPGGLPDTEHHITIVYAGKTTPEELAQVISAARQVAATHHPLHGVISGLGSFEPSEASDGLTPYFAVPNIPGIENLRPPLEHLNASQHTDFHPHMTLTYAEKGEKPPDPVPPTPVTFTHLAVHRGGKLVGKFPFTGIREETLQVRNWAKWRLEHPYIKKGYQHHPGSEVEHHVHAPKVMPDAKALPVPKSPDGLESLKKDWLEEAKQAHEFKAGSTRAQRFEAGYVAARADAHDKGMSPEDAHELSEAHDTISKGMQANQAQAKREGVAAGYHAHAVGHSLTPGAESPNPYLNGSPKSKAFDSAYAHEKDWAQSQNMSKAEALAFADTHTTDAANAAPSKKTVNGIPVKAHHQGAAQAYKDYAAGLSEKPVLETSEVSAAEVKPVTPPVGHIGVPETESQLDSMQKKSPGETFSNGEKVPNTGSNGGQWYDDGAGNAYFLKPGDDEHAMNEVAGSLAYQQAGLRAQKVTLVKMSDGHVRALSHYMTGLTPILSSKDANATTRVSARWGSGMDALMSHYDLTGLYDPKSDSVDGPNLFKDKKGNVVRLDLGGTGRFRAQGSGKASWKVGSWDHPETKADYDSIPQGDQGTLAYGKTPKGVNSLPEDMQQSLARAADFNTGQYHQAMLDAGLSKEFADHQIDVIASRQAHLHELGFGATTKPTVEPGQAGPTFHTAAYMDNGAPFDAEHAALTDHPEYSTGRTHGAEFAADMTPQEARVRAITAHNAAVKKGPAGSQDGLDKNFKAYQYGLADAFAEKAVGGGQDVQFPIGGAATPEAGKASISIQKKAAGIETSEAKSPGTDSTGKSPVYETAFNNVYNNLVTGQWDEAHAQKHIENVAALTGKGHDDAALQLQHQAALDALAQWQDYEKPGASVETSEAKPGSKALVAKGALEHEAHDIANAHLAEADYAKGYEAQPNAMNLWDPGDLENNDQGAPFSNLVGRYKNGNPKGITESKAMAAGRLGAILDKRHGNTAHAPSAVPVPTPDKILGPNGNPYPFGSDEEKKWQHAFAYAQQYAKDNKYDSKAASQSAKNIKATGVDPDAHGSIVQTQAGVDGLVAGYEDYASTGGKPVSETVTSSTSAPKPDYKIAASKLDPGDIIEHPSVGLAGKKMPVEVVGVTPSPSGKATFLTTKQLETNTQGEPGKVEDHIIKQGTLLTKAKEPEPGTKGDIPVGTTYTSPSSPATYTKKADGWYVTEGGVEMKAGTPTAAIEAAMKSPTESWVAGPAQTEQYHADGSRLLANVKTGDTYAGGYTVTDIHPEVSGLTSSTSVSLKGPHGETTIEMQNSGSINGAIAADEQQLADTTATTGKAPTGTKWVKSDAGIGIDPYYEKNADGSIDFKDSTGKVLNHDTAESTEDELAKLGWKPEAPMSTAGDPHVTATYSLPGKFAKVTGQPSVETSSTPSSAPQDVFGVPVTPAQAKQALDLFNAKNPNPQFTGMDSLSPYEALNQVLGQGEQKGEITGTSYQNIHDKLQEVAGNAPAAGAGDVKWTIPGDPTMGHWIEHPDGSWEGYDDKGKMVYPIAAGSPEAESQKDSLTMPGKEWVPEPVGGTQPPRQPSFTDQPPPKYTTVPEAPMEDNAKYAQHYVSGYAQVMNAHKSGTKTDEEIKAAVENFTGSLSWSQHGGAEGLKAGGQAALDDLAAGKEFVLPIVGKPKKHNEATSVKQISTYPGIYGSGTETVTAADLHVGNKINVDTSKTAPTRLHTVIGIVQSKKDPSKVIVTTKDNGADSQSDIHIFTVPKTAEVKAQAGEGVPPVKTEATSVGSSSTPTGGSTTVKVKNLQVGDKVKVNGNIYEITKTYASYPPDATDGNGTYVDLAESKYNLDTDSDIEKVSAATPSTAPTMVPVSSLEKGDKVKINGETYTITDAYPLSVPDAENEYGEHWGLEENHLGNLTMDDMVEKLSGSSPSGPSVVTSSTPTPSVTVPTETGGLTNAEKAVALTPTEFEGLTTDPHFNPPHNSSNPDPAIIQAYAQAYAAAKKKYEEGGPTAQQAHTAAAQKNKQATFASADEAAAQGELHGIEQAIDNSLASSKTDAQQKADDEFLKAVNTTYTGSTPFKVDPSLSSPPQPPGHNAAPPYATTASNAGYDAGIKQGYDQGVFAFKTGATPDQIMGTAVDYKNQAEAMGDVSGDEAEIMKQAHMMGLYQGASKAAYDLQQYQGTQFPNASTKSLIHAQEAAKASGNKNPYGTAAGQKYSNQYLENQSDDQFQYSVPLVSAIGSWKSAYVYSNPNATTKGIESFQNGGSPSNSSAKALWAGLAKWSKPNKQAFQRKIQFAPGSFGYDGIKKQIMDKQVGEIIDVPATSWSTDPNKWSGNVWLEVEPGAVSMDIGKVAGLESEVETISGGKYLVTGIKVEGGITHISLKQVKYLEYLPVEISPAGVHGE